MEPKKDILTEFTPVPRVQVRRDSWGPDVQRAFIEALADCGSVEAACRFVGKSTVGAYRLRRHPEGGEFAQAWQAAIDFGIQRIEDNAMDRALNGVDVPVFAYGDKIATRRVHNETLVMFILRNRLGDRYCEGKPKALNAIDKRVLDRFRKEWRAEWERERAIEEGAREKQQGDDILLKIERMHFSWYCNLSPATRAAYREFRRLEDLDKADNFMWMADEDAEPLSVAEAEYEEFFNRNRDKRPHVMKLADTLEWEKEEEEEEE